MLAIYFASMIGLNLFFFWKSWNGVRIGLPDFTIFYAAGHILHEGRGSDLYDNALQEQVQRSFAPIGLRERESILPYVHPPFEALVFLPLAWFSYLGAYLIWLAVNTVLVVCLPLVLRPHFPLLGKEPLALWLLAAFAFFPIFIAAMQGQDSIWVLLCYSLAYGNFCSKAQFRAGSWLALGLCKFQLVLPFMLALSFSAGKRLMTGFFTVTAALVFIGAAVVGIRGWLIYPAYVWAYDRNQSYRWKLALGNSANLRGLIAAILPRSSAGLKAALLIAASAVVLGGAMYTWRRLEDRPPHGLAFSVSLLATVLVSYHLYAHDLSLAFLAILIALEVIGSSASTDAWRRKIIYGCAFLLSCSPFYLLLILRYKHTEIAGGALLIFAVVLWMESMRSGTSNGRVLLIRD